ncbi:SDR family NAD(P)-dependent oxidoreductase [Blastococcus sp. SYSU D00820]
MSGQGEGAGRVALVTGGSRGVGQGIAVGLGESGWTVVVTGRGPAGAGTPLQDTVDRVTAAGGRAVAAVCDHRDDEQVAALVDGVVAEHGRLDLLVNNAWVGPGIVEAPFWERPLSEWDQLIGVGLRAHYVASRAAAPHMVARRSGLIVNISSFGARSYLHSVLYGISKAGLDKMANDMARELRPHGVSAVSFWPGLVQTEALLSRGITSVAGALVSEGETPAFQGRVLAAVAADPDLPSLSGTALISAEIAERYGITEEGGRRPRVQRELFGGGPLYPPVATAAG